MRALLWVVLAATAVWTGYWWFGASQIESGVKAWIAAQPPGVVQAGTVEVHGIPNRFDLTVSDLVVANPARQIEISSPFVQVYAMAWKPWHVIAALPSGQVISSPDQKVTVTSDSLRASVQVHPSTAIALDELVGEAHVVRLASDAGWALGLESALVSAQEDATRANTYRLGLKLGNIAPDAALLQALAASDLPPLVDEVFLDAHAVLSAKLDKNAAKSRPQLLALEIDETRATWGSLQFSAKGTLTAAPDGLAEGEIALRVAGWKRLPPILVALGLVKPDIAPTVERMLGIIAQQGGDLEVLQISLICKDGRMVLGPLPLGPAPRMNAAAGL
ncbi:hypothetical protein GCM10010873_13860 [Cypionkella aquatica]|uniref:DUF2125 domain-containing protein n=1 Tax=Cypionkella aquatica TaxID=1756042 RepID=A0AA37TXU6_9RHOB|nr:DUF2125 domain-containing protein [Cypionkella aquatica]GLS86412.1 hypothetical protein GCM10010873_13860 [Cypionkella aquatica]